MFVSNERNNQELIEQDNFDYTQNLPPEMVYEILRLLPLSDSSRALFAQRSWSCHKEDVLLNYANFLGFECKKSESESYLRTIFNQVQYLSNHGILPARLIVYRDEEKKQICLEKTLLNLNLLTRNEIVSIVSKVDKIIGGCPHLMRHLLFLSRKGMFQEIKEEKLTSHKLAVCACGNNKDAVELLLNIGLDPSSSTNGKSSLMFAILNDRIEVAKLLVERGADIHYKSQIGNVSALHQAARKSYEMTQYLIDQGADIEDTSDFGTPLWCAVEGSQIETVKLLLTKGAKAEAGSDEQRLIEDSDHREVLEEIFRSHKAEQDGIEKIGS